MDTIKAFALYGKQDIRPFDLAIPVMEPGGALLKVDYCGICGSDLRNFYDGPSPRYPLPVVLGHEFTGTVVQVGSAQKDYRVGDCVAVAPLIPCMNCAACENGKDNLCAQSQVIGVTTPGAMAEYYYVPERMVSAGGLARVPEGVHPRVAATTEIVACCLHGIAQTQFAPGDDVLVIGDGPVGLAHLQLLRLKGARKIVVTGVTPVRLKLAEELGADAALDVSKVDLAQYARENRFQPNLAIVATPVVSVSLQALDLIVPGGDLLLFSGYPKGAKMELDLYPFHYSEKHIHGSIDCTVKDFHLAVKLLPQLKMERVITHEFPLEETPGAFLAARAPDAIKTTLVVK